MAANDHEVRKPDLNNPEVKFEHKDVNEWAVAKFGIALVLLCAFSLLILAGLFKFFESREATVQTPTGIHVDARRLPPAPRLQDAPIRDLKQMRDAEDQLLNGYGWVDQQAGKVRVPIARAIDLLAQKGLPSRPQAGAQSASAATVPTESGLGYIMQRPGGPLATSPAQPPEPPAPPIHESHPLDTAMPGANPPPKYYEAPKK